MRVWLILLMTLCRFSVFAETSGKKPPATPSDAFILQHIYRVSVQPPERLDLSGLLLLTPAQKEAFHLKSDFLLVNDQSTFIYEGSFAAGGITAKRWLNLKQYFPQIPLFDLEDIDGGANKIYVVNEPDGGVFEISPPTKIKSFTVQYHTWEKTFDSKYSFSEPFGTEAIAVDPKFPSHLFLGKEMPPFGAFELDTQLSPDNRLVKVHPREAIGSQTALRVHDNKVYILDRENRSIWMSSLYGDSHERQLPFATIMKNPELDYMVKDDEGVEHPEWSTPEGLDIKNGVFYIGLDNNGLGLKAKPSETRPVIFSLKLRSDH
jgi:hypothetical protein